MLVTVDSASGPSSSAGSGDGVISGSSAGVSGLPSEVTLSDAIDFDTNNEENNNDENNEDYDESCNNYESSTQEAKDPLEEVTYACIAHLLQGVILINEDYSPGEFVRILDACANVMAMFDNVQLLAQMFIDVS
jgi:hypothetical protein